MNDSDNSHEVVHYFNSRIRELNITLPNKKEAAFSLLNYYFTEMVNSPKDAYQIMHKINDVHHSIDWSKELRLTMVKYVGEELDLEKIYNWYRKIQDWEDNGYVFYFTHLPKGEQKKGIRIRTSK